ncbi:hypothetical protein [Rhizobium alvei]|uniref:Uncharacterized protein n=1 Tax=Rhizobium alvei TaxID=1132659 RepID=A0ABT8YJZ3_9HYPH|nr:hypothetical protein [Rhizobium alvei]MDO6963987.1 hypothetical protein [Rhizobium alvei]
MSTQLHRTQAIFAAEHADLFPTLAKLLAFETSHDVETCKGIFAAAKESRDQYISQHPELANRESERTAKAGWDKVMADINARIH